MQLMKKQLRERPSIISWKIFPFTCINLFYLTCEIILSLITEFEKWYYLSWLALRGRNYLSTPDLRDNEISIYLTWDITVYLLIFTWGQSFTGSEKWYDPSWPDQRDSFDLTWETILSLFYLPWRDLVTSPLLTGAKRRTWPDLD